MQVLTTHALHLIGMCELWVLVNFTQQCFLKEPGSSSSATLTPWLDNLILGVRRASSIVNRWGSCGSLAWTMMGRFLPHMLCLHCMSPVHDNNWKQFIKVSSYWNVLQLKFQVLAIQCECSYSCCKNKLLTSPVKIITFFQNVFSCLMDTQLLLCASFKLQPQYIFRRGALNHMCRKSVAPGSPFFLAVKFFCFIDTIGRIKHLDTLHRTSGLPSPSFFSD